MKKILFVISTLRIAGAEKALVSLLNSLDKTKVNVDLFVLESEGALKKEIPEWVNYHEADEVTKAMTLEARNYLPQLIRNGHLIAAASRALISVLSKLHIKVFSWDIIKNHITELKNHYDVAISFLEDVSTYFVLDKTNADKKIGWIHIDLSNRRMLPKEIEYFNRFDSIVTISESCLEAACEAIPGIEKKICVIENIVSENEVLEKADEPANIEWDMTKVHILTVGRLEYQKGIDIAANTAVILKNKGIDFQWHVLGEGSMKDTLRDIINDNNISDCFVLEGLKTNPYPFMKWADIIVQPSRWEGKSIVLDEAKILGKPIVVTDYPSVSDQIVNNKTGIVVDLSPEGIANGIELLMSNKLLEEQLINNCLKDGNYREKALGKVYKIIGES